MFEGSQEFYDAIYSFKDYAAEGEALHALVARHGIPDGARLLEVACGTGNYLTPLRLHYRVEGIDIDPRFLEIARRKLPDVPLHLGDMTAFDLGERFDVVACLFSSIGYARTLPRMKQAVRCMARHLRPGGLLVVEPWFTPETFLPGNLSVQVVDRPGRKIARLARSLVEGEISVIEFEYLVLTPDGFRHFPERHELGLFTVEEQLEAFREAGLVATHDPTGITGRGLHVGRLS